MTTTTVHPVDEILPAGRLVTLGLQHVLVMYAGAIAVPLIVGRALNLTAEQVAILISADLFVCGVVSLIQSFGMTPWFGIKLPVMMCVTFAAVAPIFAMANAKAAQCASFVGGQGIQLHGGMGMTDEFVIGHSYKRLTMCETLFGDGEWHLRRLAAQKA